jgi:DNA-binding transcriptional LysR family regulator
MDQLDAFLAVVKYQSFRLASEHLYLSQPSLSSRIRALEKDLDASLFIRDGRKVTLSGKGEVFVPYAKRIVRTYRKAWHALHPEQAT